MRLQITITEDLPGVEIARILQVAAEAIIKDNTPERAFSQNGRLSKHHFTGGAVRDPRGAPVGRWVYGCVL